MDPNVSRSARSTAGISQVIGDRSTVQKQRGRALTTWLATQGDTYYDVLVPVTVLVHDVLKRIVANRCRWETCALTSAMLLLLQLVLTNRCGAQESPIVGAFERHARHAEMSPIAAGLLLLTELNCTSCHVPPDERPELRPRGAPNLSGVAQRVRTNWIREFLLSPSTTKPGTTMPDVLSGHRPDVQVDAVEALVAYLRTLNEALPEIKATGANPVLHEFWNRGDVAAGHQLYHQIGCVACHEPDSDDRHSGTNTSNQEPLPWQDLDADEVRALGLTAAMRETRSIPFSNLRDKYTLRGLTQFLLDPHAVRPGGRMPDFGLLASEAADLAAFLVGRYTGNVQGQRGVVGQKKQPASATRRALGIDAANASNSNADRGLRLFREYGCVNCHAVAQTEDDMKAAIPTLLALARHMNDKSRLDHGCLSPVARVGNEAPLAVYSLDETQRRALVQSIIAIGRGVETAYADFSLMQRDCLACHERDQRGGVGRGRRQYFETVHAIDLGDEGRLPPSLTGVETKLRRNWLERVLRGKGRIRAHMHARMPGFDSDLIRQLTRQWVAAQSTASNASANGDVDSAADTKRSVEPRVREAERLEAGRTLLNIGCVECHSVRGLAVPGVVGVDLHGIDERVTYDWFRRFLVDPAAVKARTRMPTFFPNGQSQNNQVMNGDVDQQIQAIWQYLKVVDKHSLPEKIEIASARDTELVPSEQPSILRTFMNRAGTHAIAVGDPVGVHYALDAERLFLAEIWRGRFLDARSTWYDRFATPVDPLGTDVVGVSMSPEWAVLTDVRGVWQGDTSSNASKFQGYRLDKQGKPTFQYQVGGYTVEDTMSATAAGASSLARRIRVRVVADEGDAPSKLLVFRPFTGGSAMEESHDKQPTAQRAAGTSKARSDVREWKRSRRRHDGLLVTVSGEITREIVLNDGAEWRVEIQPVGPNTSRCVEVNYSW